LLLSDLIARLLPFGRGHPTPPLHVALEALALIGAHRLISLEPLAEELLLLEREPLKALVGRVQLTLSLRRERLEVLEIFLHTGAIGRRHPAQPLVVLSRGLPLLGREAPPLAVVVEGTLPLLRGHLPPLLQVALGLGAVLGREAIEAAHGRLARRGSGLRLRSRRRGGRLREGKGRPAKSRGESEGAKRAS